MLTFFGAGRVKNRRKHVRKCTKIYGNMGKIMVIDSILEPDKSLEKMLTIVYLFGGHENLT
jgi:hypothetical protein